MTLTNQNIKGNIVVGNSSSLTLQLINSSIEGMINTDKTAAKLAITLDNNSTITLTGNSYYTSLTNSVSNNSNIITGNYSWISYNESSISSSNSSGSNTPPGGPNGTAPNGTFPGGPNGTIPQRPDDNNNTRIYIIKEYLKKKYFTN